MASKDYDIILNDEHKQPLKLREYIGGWAWRFRWGSEWHGHFPTREAAIKNAEEYVGATAVSEWPDTENQTQVTLSCSEGKWQVVLRQKKLQLVLPVNSEAHAYALVGQLGLLARGIVINQE